MPTRAAGTGSSRARPARQGRPRSRRRLREPDRHGRPGRRHRLPEPAHLSPSDRQYPARAPISASMRSSVSCQRLTTDSPMSRPIRSALRSILRSRRHTLNLAAKTESASTSPSTGRRARRPAARPNLHRRDSPPRGSRGLRMPGSSLRLRSTARRGVLARLGANARQQAPASSRSCRPPVRPESLTSGRRRPRRR